MLDRDVALVLLDENSFKEGKHESGFDILRSIRLCFLE